MNWYQLTQTGLVSLATHNMGQSQSVEVATVPNLRALAYGDGFFTTMGVHQGHLLWLSYHQQRVQHHCQALQFYYPSTIEQLLWSCAKQLAEDAGHGIIKIIVSRQSQPLRGYAYAPELTNNACLIWLGVSVTAPLAEQTAQFLVSASSASAPAHDIPAGEQVILQQSPIMATCLSARLASLPAPLAGLKSLNRLDGVMIAGELQRQKQIYPNLAEGLVADMAGDWTEGVMSNVFYQLKPVNQPSDAKAWYTPPLQAAGVRGVMRQVILDQLAAQGQPVMERALQDDDLPNIRAMFFCNAVRGVIPVRELLVEGQWLRLFTAAYRISSVC